jgi:hypothetical protein
VLERVKDPVKNLLSREEPSTMYAVLSHVLLLLQRAPVIFEQVSVCVCVLCVCVLLLLLQRAPVIFEQVLAQAR